MSSAVDRTLYARDERRAQFSERTRVSEQHEMREQRLHGPSRSATRAARLTFVASLRGMASTNSIVLGTLYPARRDLQYAFSSSSLPAMPSVGCTMAWTR